MGENETTFVTVIVGDQLMTDLPQLFQGVATVNGLDPESRSETAGKGTGNCRDYLHCRQSFRYTSRLPIAPAQNVVDIVDRGMPILNDEVY